MSMSNKTYDFLKWLSQIVLPAIGTLYFAVANIWGLPYAEQVVGTITALVTFFGVVLHISTVNYVKSDTYGNGTLLIDQTNPTKDIYRLDIRTPLEDVKEMKTIALKVDSDAKLS